MGKGYGIASLVLGIISIIFCLLGYLPLICGILAIVFATIHYKKEGKKKEGHGLATAGLVTGIIGTLFSALYSLVWSAIFATI